MTSSELFFDFDGVDVATGLGIAVVSSATISSDTSR
jgi:hypothetical protein